MSSPPSSADRPPDIVIVMTDEERATPPYETAAVSAWRDQTLPGRRWFDQHGVNFVRHYTGSLACVPSRPTIFTGHYPPRPARGSPRPTASARPRTTHGCAGCVAARSPPHSATGSAPRVMTPTTTASGTSLTPT